MALICRDLREDDFEGWKTLFVGYLEFYEVSTEDEKVQTMWNWLMDKNHMFEGRVAECDERGLVALAHFHAWPSPLAGKNGSYLSDLFTRPDVRGEGIGDALYKDVLDLCRGRGYCDLGLLTHETNTVGQKLYAKHGGETGFIAFFTEFE